jgi:hypothetical protein
MFIWFCVFVVLVYFVVGRLAVDLDKHQDKMPGAFDESPKRRSN